MKRLKTPILITLVFIAGYMLYLKQCGPLKQQTATHTEDMLNWITTQQGSIHIQTFKSDSLTGEPQLVFVIHGDAPFNNPGYHYRLAETLARQNRNTIAIGILRPGYTDPTGNTSTGERGLTNGDNYTTDVLATIAETILKLKSHYRPAKTILVGHSGGSAISADIAGMYPGLVNAVVLVSCPCNLQSWRWHMFRKQSFNPVWLLPVGSVSPVLVAEGITDSTQVTLITGVADDITPIAMPYQYYQQLKALHKNARHIALAGQGHEILLEDTVVRTIGGMLK